MASGNSNLSGLHLPNVFILLDTFNGINRVVPGSAGAILDLELADYLWMDGRKRSLGGLAPW